MGEGPVLRTRNRSEGFQTGRCRRFPTRRESEPHTRPHRSHARRIQHPRHRTPYLRMARRARHECRDDTHSDDGNRRIHRHFRLAHRHARAHQYDWHPESTGSHQHASAPHIPAFRRDARRQGNHHWRYDCFGTLLRPETIQLHQTRCRHLLYRFRPHRIQLAFLPIDSVPIEFNWLFFLLINFGVLLISALIIFGSSFLMSIKGPATTIRWE